MAKEILSDEHWGVLAPLLPEPPPRPKGGRQRIPTRAVLGGILFVLRPGLPWEWLPPELGGGSGRTCWRRLQEWQARGVWQKLHQRWRDCLGEADDLEWSRAAMDAATVAAPGGAKNPGRIPRTAANRARSAILWSTAKAFPWPSSSRPPM